MKKTNNKEVFPEGLKVLLPEEARKEEHITRRINDFFYKNGYQPVKTPLMEYEKKEKRRPIGSLGFVFLDSHWTGLGFLDSHWTGPAHTGSCGP